MALGTILGAVAGGLASAGASALGSRLLGGGSTTPKFKPANIDAGGLTSTFNKKSNTIGVSSSGLRQGLVGRVAATFPEQAKLLAGLRASVAPGTSALRASRLASIENSRRSAVGDLRENLQRRRVLGSSFAQDALTRSELSFAQQKDAIEADTFMQELELTNALASAEFDARRAEFQTHLDELNLQADVATQLASGVTSQLGANARLVADLNAQSAAGAGEFFGSIFQPVSDAISNAFKPKAA